MPSPLEQIKEGILNNDLALVAAGYKSLTGQDVLPAEVEQPKKRGRPKKNTAKLVVPGDEEYDEGIEEIREPQFQAPQRGQRRQPALREQPSRNKRKSRWEEIEEEQESEGSAAKREPINTKKIKQVGNLWQDDGTIDTTDRKTWAKVYPKNHKSQGRAPDRKVRIKCTRCKDVLELYRSEIVNDPFICNDCTTSVGR